MRKRSTQHQYTTSNVAYIKKLTIFFSKKDLALTTNKKMTRVSLCSMHMTHLVGRVK